MSSTNFPNNDDNLYNIAKRLQWRTSPHRYIFNKWILRINEISMNQQTHTKHSGREIGTAADHRFGLIPNRITKRSAEEFVKELERPGLHFALDKYEKLGLHVPLESQPLGVQIPLGIHIPLGWGIHIPISLHVPLTIHAPRGVHLLLGLHVPLGWDLPFSLHIPLGFEMGLDFFGLGKTKHGHDVKKD